MVAVSSHFLTPAALAACELRSGQKTAALVELYTSEGCSSCPPADRQLGRLREALGPDADVVPLALHVGYWDYIGWKDPYAQAAFAKRQSWLVQANGQRTLYTPQFFVGGAELRARHTSLRDEVRRLNAVPAAATIELQAGLVSPDTLALNARASSQGGGPTLALYVVLTESGLVSRVTRGENTGATLEHEHVVREWIGPVRLGADGVQLSREVPLASAWDRRKLELAAFVQDESSGRVLQAVGGHCAAF